MKTYINSADELRAEIARLREVEQQQGAALLKRVNSPSAVYHTIVSMFKSPDGTKSNSSFFAQDFFGLASRVLLPLTLNKTLFRNSNFLVKTAVGFLSQKASHFINEGTVTGVWDKVTSLFHKKPKAETAEGSDDHRIPVPTQPA